MKKKSIANTTFHKKSRTKDENFPRRSFIRKSAIGSLGILFYPCVAGADSGSCQANRTKEETDKQIDELVNKYFPVYRTCSQTSFHVLNEIFDLKSENIIRALASIPGVVYRGETCGAVIASVLAIGLVYEENTIDEERKRSSFQPSIKFCTTFENEYGTTRCTDVIEHASGKKYPVTKPEDYQQLALEGALKHCPSVLKITLKMAAGIILAKAEKENQPS